MHKLANPPHWAAILCLLGQAIGHADTGFPIRVSARVAKPRPDSTLKVLLERDDSRRWQQYLDGVGVAQDGEFQIAIQRPGLYWLLATEETDWSYRRGACLLEVRAKGDYSLRPLPGSPVGNKWGGKRATSICKQGIVPLAVFRGKPVRRKPN